MLEDALNALVAALDLNSGKTASAALRRTVALMLMRDSIAGLARRDVV